MPQFTITISDQLLAKLQAVVDRTNADQGLTLTVRDWILLHLKEIAIAPDVAAAVDTLRGQAERDATAALEAAVKAERDRLLGAL